MKIINFIQVGSIISVGDCKLGWHGLVGWIKHKRFHKIGMWSWKSPQ